MSPNANKAEDVVFLMRAVFQPVIPLPDLYFVYVANFRAHADCHTPPSDSVLMDSENKIIVMLNPDLTGQAVKKARSDYLASLPDIPAVVPLDGDLKLGSVVSALRGDSACSEEEVRVVVSLIIDTAKSIGVVPPEPYLDILVELEQFLLCENRLEDFWELRDNARGDVVDALTWILGSLLTSSRLLTED